MTDSPATRRRSRDKSARRERTPPRPLDPARMEELALAYVARFATTAAKLETYLKRKLRERGWEGGEDAAVMPDVRGLIERFIDARYVDDEGWSRMRARGLLARGYGARRVEQALRAGGVAEEVRAAMAPDERARREAVLVLARRRALCPFGQPRGEDAEALRKRREKQLAALVRAGHGFDAARKVTDARTVEELEEWVEQVHED